LYIIYGYPVWGTPICVRTYACIIGPVYRIYYVITPIRVGIHICVGAGRKDVKQHTSLLYPSTPTNIYKYPTNIKNGPHKGGRFPILPILEKKHKVATFFFKKPFWAWEIYTNLLVYCIQTYLIRVLIFRNILHILFK
jgi:hypothetical protein